MSKKSPSVAKYAAMYPYLHCVLPETAVNRGQLHRNHDPAKLRSVLSDLATWDVVYADCAMSIVANEIQAFQPKPGKY